MKGAMLLLAVTLLTLVQLCAGLRPSFSRETNLTTTGVSALNLSGQAVDAQLPFFKTINRRKLGSCFDPNPFLKMTVDVTDTLADVHTVTVNVSGIFFPTNEQWVAVVSPSDTSTDGCVESGASYVETGDLEKMPLLCHYPVKFQYMTNDPGYLPCTHSECQVKLGVCGASTCSGLLTFRLINIRTDILFVFFAGGMVEPCILYEAGPLSFANPNSPLYGHLSSVDSSGTSMRLTWVSGDAEAQRAEYGDGLMVFSTPTTFTKSDLCSPGAASDFGWHDPGYIHTAVMTGLSPSTLYEYRYGSEKVGFSQVQEFKTPPEAGGNKVTIIAYADMGKAERDGSLIHYTQPGSLSVIDAVTQVVNNDGADFVFHLGDISYATGFLVEWENFLDVIGPVASRVPYMTAIGNHERDNPASGSYYELIDSGGECGIPYYHYFQMPTSAQDKPWYSIESGPIHFTVTSTEHDWNVGTEQYNWIQQDLASVDRSRTPWVIFSGHRPMYSSVTVDALNVLPAVDPDYAPVIEPLLQAGQVDLVLSGHVHNYERLCAVSQGQCLQTPTKDSDGLDVFDFSTYTAPVQAVIGMAGFTLDFFRPDPAEWSSVRLSAYGYTKIEASSDQLLFTFLLTDGTVADTFAIVK